MVKTAVTARWQGWASFGLALWLAMSPWICGYAADEGLATGNAAFMGIALALASHFEVAVDADFVDWLNLIAGTWLAAAPFLLGFADAAVPAINSIAVGTLVLAFAVSALSLDKQFEKWWNKQFAED
jgi:hypothetical protein